MTTRPGTTRPGTALDRVAASPGVAMSYDESRAWAERLAKTDLVKKVFQGKPDAIMLVGAMGARMGLDMIQALQSIDVIDNSPVPNAQTKLGQIRVAGHEAVFTVHTSERAVLRARRAEYRDDPTKWQEVEWTTEDAREAGMLDEWVERWVEKPKRGGGTYSYKEVVLLRREGDGYVNAAFGATELPDWTRDEIKYGRVKRNDTWWRRRANMLRAACARDMHRIEFSDLLFSEFVAPLDRLVDDSEDGQADEDDDVVDAELVDQAENLHRGVGEEGGGGSPENGTGDAMVVEPPVAVPAPTSAEGWRALAKECGVTQADLLRQARELAAEMGVAVPDGLVGIDDAGLAEALVSWLEGARA